MLVRWLLLLLAVLSVFTFLSVRMREVVLIFAESDAENILLKASDKAVLSVFEENDIKYDAIAHTFRDEHGAVCDVQIDTAGMNRLKNLISAKMHDLTDDNEYAVYIPAGTLLKNEFTTGMGPKLRFHASLAYTADVHYKSVFTAAGINNILHQILILTEIRCSVISFGATRSFTIKNEVIAAQSVIAGTVPDSYTSVYENDPDKFADDIFNYSK